MTKRLNLLQKLLLSRLPVEKRPSDDLLEHGERLHTASNHHVMNSDSVVGEQVLSFYKQIPGVRNWKKAINKWEDGCPSKNLINPLKQCPHGIRTKDLKYRYHYRKLIAIEYSRLGKTSFVEKYDPDNCTLKELKHKIRCERKSSSGAEINTGNDSENDTPSMQ